jgi:hypothetical protein
MTAPGQMVEVTLENQDYDDVHWQRRTGPLLEPIGAGEQAVHRLPVVNPQPAALLGLEAGRHRQHPFPEFSSLAPSPARWRR